MTVVILFLQLPTPFFSGPKFRSVHQPVNLQKAPRNEKKKKGSTSGIWLGSRAGRI